MAWLNDHRQAHDNEDPEGQTEAAHPSGRP
jgi:hypothetical protein